MLHNDTGELYRKCAGKKLTFSVVCEVGVYKPETSNILDFIHSGTKAILVEPDENSLKRIYEVFRDKHVEVHPCAIYDYNGKLELVQRDASTFAKDLPSSPAQANDNYKIDEQDTFTVDCKVFSEIDPGTIELLSIDTEGCEWYVLKNLISRPKIISMETHGRFYTNPFMKDIRNWIRTNDYRVWYKTKSDTVYFKKGTMKLSLTEFTDLFFMHGYIFFRRLKKIFYRRN
jgi:FkbM family methyltransferase